jgi:hypothetical protein
MFRQWLVRVVAAITLAILGFLVWYAWDSRKNHGFTFGYYGQFNTMSNALASLPGVRITSATYNGDITLEGIFFEIDRGGRHLNIVIAEQDPVRRLSGAKLEKALSELVEKESAAQAVN